MPLPGQPLPRRPRARCGTPAASAAPASPRSGARRWRASLGLIASLLLLTPGLLAQDDGAVDLTTMSLEDLLDIEVQISAASRRPQALRTTAAAVSVLTREDIARSGATTVPEALRLVPGVHVARVSGNTWAVGIRGFNGTFSNKLLVLVDGRSVYTPIFSGVFWDEQDLVLEDVERIEVVRGPGAAVWGANAVNGVINIITRSSADTQGTLVSESVGTLDRWSLTLRRGGTLGEDGTWRAWAKGFDRGETDAPGGGDGEDLTRMRRVGFRYDGGDPAGDGVMLQGSAYRGTSDFRGLFVDRATASYLEPAVSQDLSGGHVLGRWSHAFSDDSRLETQVYADRTERDALYGDLRVDTLDLDLKHDLALDEDHAVWGLEYRFVHSDLQGTPLLSFTDHERDDRMMSGFVEYDHALVPDLLHVIVGTRIEDHTSVGVEVQPSASFVYTPDATSTLWGAVSRAARTPSLTDRFVVLDAAVTPPPPVAVVSTLTGNPDIESELVKSYELGWRQQLSDDVDLDVTVFYDDYDDLTSVEPGTPAPLSPGVFGVALAQGNAYQAISRGAEIALGWDVDEDWRLDASYSHVDIHASLDAGATVVPGPTFADEVPHHLLKLHARHALAEDADLDLALGYTSRIRAYDVDAAWRLDLGFTERLTEHTELRIGVRNLLHAGQREWGDEYLYQANDVPASVTVQVTHRF